MFVPASSQIEGLVHDTSRIICNWFRIYFPSLTGDVVKGPREILFACVWIDWMLKIKRRAREIGVGRERGRIIK